jgi:hypothetical protein
VVTFVERLSLSEELVEVTHMSSFPSGGLVVHQLVDQLLAHPSSLPYGPSSTRI